MVLASPTAISQSCAGTYPVSAQVPLARNMLRHLLHTQLNVWERDKGTGRSRELWTQEPVMAGKGRPPGGRGM